MRAMLTAMVAILLVSGTAMGAPAPAATCESDQLKVASKYAACRLKARASAVLKSVAADYTKCETRFAAKWSVPETKAGPGICTSEGDQADVEALIATFEGRLGSRIEGWTCYPDFYDDGACDCGCGVPDSAADCPDALVATCDFCDDEGSCSLVPGCPGTISPADNSKCTP
jgi:hypothetical protein